MKDLADYQAEAINLGYTHDFGYDAKSEAADFINELHSVEYVSFDNARMLN